MAAGSTRSTLGSGSLIGIMNVLMQLRKARAHVVVRQYLVELLLAQRGLHTLRTAVATALAVQALGGALVQPPLLPADLEEEVLAEKHRNRKVTRTKLEGRN